MSPSSLLADLARSANALAAVAWDDEAAVAEADLPHAAAELARVQTQVEAALVLVAERLSVTDAAADHGWASAKDFLTHLVGGRKGAGGGLVRTAEQTAGLPAVRAAMTTGAVSVAQARVIGARVATLPRVPELRDAVTSRLLELATVGGHDATDLDRAFADVLDAADPDRTVRGAEADLPLAERGAHAARHLSFTPDAAGGVRIRGYASAEEAETVKATLMPLAAPETGTPGACGGDPTFAGPARDRRGLRIRRGCPDPACSHDGRDRRDHGARMWDALHEACRRLQAHQGHAALPQAHGTTARLTVTIDHDQLVGDLDGRGLLPGGGSISAAAVRRLACDAEVLPVVLGTRSQVLDVGRAQRLVTTPLWHALVTRDRHCAFPGCARLPLACDAHHLTHWADGGATSLDNLVLLCRRHHTLAHHSPWTVHLDPRTRRPVWTPPPVTDDRHHFTYHPATPPAPPPAAPTPTRAA